MSKERKQYDPKSREILYNFWEKLPEQRIVTEYEDDFFKHFARKLTFGILGKGIREKLPSGKLITRKALNAQEILQEINDTLDIKFKIKEDREKFDLSLHSLYFHLQKLEEVGFIQTIAILKEGRHNVAYYSRPAKIVLFKDEYAEDEKIRSAFSSMEKLVHILYPEIETEKFMEYYKKYEGYLQGQIGNPEGDDKPNKKYYDPRKWLREAEKSMVDRLKQAFDDLNCIDRS